MIPYMTYQELATYLWLLSMMGIWFTAREMFYPPHEEDEEWF